MVAQISNSSSRSRSLRDFTDQILIEQLTLITQRLLLSIPPREWLCSNWDNETMEKQANCILRFQKSFDNLRKFTYAQVKNQPTTNESSQVFRKFICIAEVRDF